MIERLREFLNGAVADTLIERLREFLDGPVADTLKVAIPNVAAITAIHLDPRFLVELAVGSVSIAYTIWRWREDLSKRRTRSAAKQRRLRRWEAERRPRDEGRGR